MTTRENLEQKLVLYRKVADDCRKTAEQLEQTALKNDGAAEVVLLLLKEMEDTSTEEDLRETEDAEDVGAT